MAASPPCSTDEVAVMVHWIDNVAFGVDFRKHREQKPETLEQMAAQIFDGINLPDTAPCEMVLYLAKQEDPA
jgi:hypothetical protein